MKKILILAVVTTSLNAAVSSLTMMNLLNEDKFAAARIWVGLSDEEKVAFRAIPKRGDAPGKLMRDLKIDLDALAMQFTPAGAPVAGVNPQLEGWLREGPGATFVHIMREGSGKAALETMKANPRDRAAAQAALRESLEFIERP